MIWRDEEVGEQVIPHGVQLLGFMEDADFLQYRRFLSQNVGGRAE